jgi:aspartate aminotransferase
MPIASRVRESLAASSWIRRMFEEGLALRAQYGADQVFDLSLGNPDLEPPPEFRSTLQELVSDETRGSHAYMPNAGYLETRAAVAAKVSREHRVSLGPDQVVMSVGAAGGLNVVLKTLLNPGDEVLVVRPYFVEYAAYVNNHGGVLRTLEPTPDFLLDPETVAAGLGEKTAAVLVNSPNNPTGRLYPESVWVELGERLRVHHARGGRRVLLLVDEPYRDLVYEGRMAPPIACHYADTVVVSSFSKSLSLAGERIGYVAVNPQCEDASELVAGLVMCNRTLGFVNAPALMQRVITRLAAVKLDLTPYARRRERLCIALRELGLTFAQPDGAFYLFCRCPTPDDQRFVLFLKDHRLLSVPGSGFGFPGWFRLSYAVPDATVQGAISRLRTATQAWKDRSRSPT